MPGQWKIIDGILCAQLPNGSLKTPLSQDIFALVNNRLDIISDKSLADMPNLVDDNLGLTFARFSQKIIVCFDFDVDTHTIEMALYASNVSSDNELRWTSSQQFDHIIIGNVWTPLSYNFEIVKELLLETEMFPGVITLKSYLQNRKLISERAGIICIDNVLEKSENFQINPNPSLPHSFKGELYPYQALGFSWLRYITNNECGCILGDEMGLGKTIQVIALLSSRLIDGTGPSLVVAPISLLENWRRELKKFAPSLKVLIHHGNDRTGRFREFEDFDIVVTAYSTVVNDLSIMKMVEWDVIVLDEAQNIKNADTARSKSVKSLSKNCGIAVTGTPFENSLGDVWSLYDFAFEGYLGTWSDFSSIYEDSLESAEKVEPLITPLLLRRKVKDVAKDLPDRVDIDLPIAMPEIEALHYEEQRKQAEAEFRNSAASISILQKLRMFCTHPNIVGENINTDPAKSCAKYSRLCELMQEISLKNEKAILFTSYLKMFEIFQHDIPLRLNIPVYVINGSTPVEDRQLLIDEFGQLSSSALLVLNPEVAGVGLNITSASHVIHYTLEWNPALEDQATARAYRRGQEKTVFVYRIFYVDTVEEAVNQRLQMKRGLASAAIVGTEGEEQNVNELLQAVRLTPKGESNYE